MVKLFSKIVIKRELCSKLNILFQLYEEVLEKPLLKETKEYYRREAAELHADNTCHAFITKVCQRMLTQMNAVNYVFRLCYSTAQN